MMAEPGRVAQSDVATIQQDDNNKSYGRHVHDYHTTDTLMQAADDLIPENFRNISNQNTSSPINLRRRISPTNSTGYSTFPINDTVRSSQSRKAMKSSVDDSLLQGGVNRQQYEHIDGQNIPLTTDSLNLLQISATVKSKEKKEKKSITTKTFAHGMMDVSLLTSNATQLRSVMSNPDHDFYKLLIGFIIASVILQISSSILLILSDYFKTQVKEKDRQNQRKRKLLNFISLIMVTITTALNVLISAFYTPPPHQNIAVSKAVKDVPVFSSSVYERNTNHTEL